MIWLGCGDNDDNIDAESTVDDIRNADKTDIVGTWKLISFEPQVAGVGPLPEQTFIINANGIWCSITVLEVPALGKFTVTAKGTYKISGNKVTGETTAIEIEPNFRVSFAIPSGITGESVVKRNANKLTITSKDEATGETITMVYQE